MIPVCGTKIWGNELKYLKDCVETRWLSSLGSYVRRFEEKFSSTIGTNHAIACSSGTAGLYAAVHCLGIGEGDEVIIPNFTIVVSANVVILNGAKPVLVDVEPDTWCIDPAKVKAAITTNTKAIMVVHMYGHPTDMDKINAIARKHNLYVIEDCCQSHGAVFKGKYTGSLADVSVFSFYSNKIITSGEGGIILTNSGELRNKLSIFIDNGFQIPRFKHNLIGFNFRMSNLQAAVALAQTENLNNAVKRKRGIAIRYIEGLKDFHHVTLPVEKEGVKNVYWMFSILINDSFGMTKDELMIALKKEGVDSRSFFYGMNIQPVFQNPEQPNYPDISGSYPVSDDLSYRGLYLPSGLDLTDEHIDFCLEKLKQLAKTGKKK